MSQVELMRQPLGMAVATPEAGPQPRWHRAGTRPWGVGGGSCMSAGNAHRTPPRLSRSRSGRYGSRGETGQGGSHGKGQVSWFVKKRGTREVVVVGRERREQKQGRDRAGRHAVRRCRLLPASAVPLAVALSCKCPIQPGRHVVDTWH